MSLAVISVFTNGEWEVALNERISIGTSFCCLLMLVSAISVWALACMAIAVAINAGKCL
jgi:hypothetical protein